MLPKQFESLKAKTDLPTYVGNHCLFKMAQPSTYRATESARTTRSSGCLWGIFPQRQQPDRNISQLYSLELRSVTAKFSVGNRTCSYSYMTAHKTGEEALELPGSCQHFLSPQSVPMMTLPADHVVTVASHLHLIWGHHKPRFFFLSCISSKLPPSG